MDTTVRYRFALLDLAEGWIELEPGPALNASAVAPATPVYGISLQVSVGVGFRSVP